MSEPPRRIAGPLRPNRGERRLINIVGGGLWLSGGAWLIFRYFLRQLGEWGPEPNVLEPWWLRLHGAFAFAALWTFGLLWGVHIARAWGSGDRRRTGLLLLTWLVVQAGTGYLLLYAGDDGVFSLLSPVHWVSGLALPAVYGLHRFLRRA